MMNLSTTVFTTSEMDVLHKRLKFNQTITITKQLEELAVDTEIAIRNITNSKYKLYLQQVVAKLSETLKHQLNILETPQSVKQRFRKITNHNLFICKTDKGNCTTIMNK